MGAINTELIQGFDKETARRLRDKADNADIDNAHRLPPSYWASRTRASPQSTTFLGWAKDRVVKSLHYVDEQLNHLLHDPSETELGTLPADQNIFNNKADNWRRANSGRNRSDR